MAFYFDEWVRPLELAERRVWARENELIRAERDPHTSSTTLDRLEQAVRDERAAFARFSWQVARRRAAAA